MNNRIMKMLIVCGAAFVLLPSCLKHGLPAYPLYTGDYINHVYFQYRYLDSNALAWGEPTVAIENLQVSQQIDTADNTVTCQITVPQANGDFDSYQRSLVSLDSLWCYMDVSPAATVMPLGGAPELAYQGNYSIPQQYKVVAPNPDSVRVWTIKVTSFSK
jgi:DUF5018-related